MDQIKDHPLYRKHNIDSAMSSLWEFYKTRFLALFLISLVMSIILQYTTILIDIKELQKITDPMLLLEKLRGYIIPLLIFTLVTLFFNNVFHYYILHKPLDTSQNIFKCIYKSLKYFIPYLIMTILLAFVGSIAIALGLLALIIGVFFSLIYVVMICFFILPVMMTEEADIRTTVTRTVALSHRNFWTNIGWTAVFIILYIIISIVLSGIVFIPFAGSFIKTFANPQDTSKIMNLTTDPIFLLLSSVINALTLPLVPVFGYIIYFNGRAREEEVHLHSSGSDTGYKVRIEDLYAKPRIEEGPENGTQG
jgi:hypothetical protein